MSRHTSPGLAAAAQRAANDMLQALDGAGAILVATADGFEIAHAGRRDVDPARLAAMVSSLAALGAAASQETRIGSPRCLVVESTEGRLVVRCIDAHDASLVLVAITDPGVLLGLVWSQLSIAERTLQAP